jgi:hypothetical protein
VSVLGLNMIKSLTLSMGVVDTLPKDRESPLLSLLVCGYHSSHIIGDLPPAVKNATPIRSRTLIVLPLAYSSGQRKGIALLAGVAAHASGDLTDMSAKHAMSLPEKCLEQKSNSCLDYVNLIYCSLAPAC